MADTKRTSPNDETLARNPDTGQTFQAPKAADTDDIPDHALTDVVTPQTDADLNSALADSFPASDPINFAGSTTGIPAEGEITPPVGTHPMAGTDEDSTALDDAIPPMPEPVEEQKRG